MDKPILSIDMACTLFWEIGCDPRNPHRGVREALWQAVRYLKGRGYDVSVKGDPYRIYKEIWRRILDRGPRRELWYRYILLKFAYSIGAEIDHVVLDEIYDVFLEARAKAFHLPGSHRLLVKNLRARGYRVVLTTATAAHDLILRILERQEALSLFDLVFSTQLAGIPKTDDRFYLELVDTLGVDPHMIIHVGDSLEGDIYPARRAGLKTIYYGWRTGCRASDPSPCILDLWMLPGYLL